MLNETVLALVCALAMTPCSARAQDAAPAFGQLLDGACSITIADVPPGVDVHQIRIAVLGQTLTVRPASRSGRITTLKLINPLHEGYSISAEWPVPPVNPPTPPMMTTIGPVVVMQAVQQEKDAPPETCEDKLQPDDRNVFEASAYLGQSFDNFAPREKGAYFNLPPDLGVDSRFLAGTEVQYRLVGQKGHTFQIWLSSYTLHGVRTSDVNCNDTTSAPICSTRPQDAQNKFLAILAHATSLEAHFDTRVEFLTLQPDSDTPIKVFGFSRFGFVDVNGAPKVYNADSFGAGIVAPAGVFKNSSATVGWGRSEQFQSAERAIDNPQQWHRLKVSGTLIFDVAPGLKDQLEFWKRLAGSPRAFISIYVDRNPGGPGPDSITTYVGIDLDLRHLFFGFGG